MKKLLVQVLKYFVGLLFIFSGLIKQNDPTGTAIKLEEYFEVFASDFSSVFLYLVPYSMFFSVVMNTLEVVLGIGLIVQYRYKTILKFLLAMIVFFSFLTFYSAYFNKVTDCGCFGDAIKLTPWQSFSKDIVLLISIVFLLTQKEPQNFFHRKLSSFVVALGFVGTLGLAWFALNHLPPIDFLAYKKGAHLPTMMQPSAPFHFKYIMEKDGQTKEYDEYPMDTTLKFKEMVLINPEAKPKITDYKVWTPEGDDVTESTFKGKKLIVVIVDARKTSIEGVDRVKKLISQLKGSDVEPMVLTGTDELTFEHFRQDVQLGIPYFFVDGVVLKAMIRSNPGVIYMENGTIKGKWHHNDVPTAKELKKL